MDSDYINENQVADRYLMGQLTPEESAEFEERLLWDKEVQDELILCQKLRQGIKDAETARVPRPRAKERAPGMFASWLTDILASPAYAVAASLMVVVLAGVLLVSRPFETTPPEFTGTRVLPLITTRGPGDAPVEFMRGKSAQELILLTLDPGPGAYRNYRLTVFRKFDNGELTIVAQFDRVQPDYGGNLVIGFPGNRFTPGDYLVRAEGWKIRFGLGSESTDRDYDSLTEIPFRVAAAGP